MRSRVLVSGGWVLMTAGAAYLCWALAGPSEQRRREIVRVTTPGESGRGLGLGQLPESNQAQLQASKRRNALVMQIIKESAETEENVARRQDWNKPTRSDS
ncbi:ubiquinol-cytochrome-c reductase complex assembly factor 3 isoform X1 [Heterodontus francisci]|uniref:ubiquinol-cytochrome-c reductase complex assembly factor 3 isoform X1 n=1 Tax=Heterodontus francisci TaxID=7792 RepID=UPI00355B1FDD